MSRTLYIHVGPAKTGTSAIQSAFQELRDERLAYPETGRWPDGSHNLLTFSVVGFSDWGDIRIPPSAEIIEDFSAEISTAPHDCLISSEALQLPADYALFLEEIGQATRGFDELRPILTIRHPLERIASYYNQHVKDHVHSEASLPDDYLRENCDGFFLSDVIRDWFECAPNLSLLPYYPSYSLVRRFCGLIGRPDLAPSSAPKVNRSLGGVALSLLLLANRHLTDAGSRETFFQRMQATRALNLWHGPSFPFSRKAVEMAISGPLRDDLEQLKWERGIDLTRWTMPEAIALTKPECAMVRKVANELLPPGPDLEADLDAILAVFGGLGKIKETGNAALQGLG